MYDTYARYIYEWLVNTFYPSWQSQGASILTKIDNILTIIQNGLYLGVFVFLFWVLYSILKPYLFRI